jgi:hypothetical protein
MNAITLRPVISSTDSLKGPRIAIWKDCRVALTCSQSPASISVRSAVV